MLSTAPRHPITPLHNTFGTFNFSFQPPSARSCLEYLRVKSKYSAQPNNIIARPSVCRRMRNYMKGPGSSKRQQPCTTYVLVTKKSVEDQPAEGAKSDTTRSVSTITPQHENLTARDFDTDVNPLAISSTVNEDSAFESNSLEMKSHHTRDSARTHQSRQFDNQPAADLGSINGYLAHHRHIVIDRLMALLEEWLENNPAFSRRAQEGSESPSGSVASGQGSTCSAGSNKARGPTRSKRSLQSDGADGSGYNGDGDGEDRRDNKRSRVDPPGIRRLACPFFKKEPSKYKNKQACTGPGWANISRLKEHIYRCHYKAHKCHRCYTSFESAEDFEAHQRLDEPCRKRSPKHDDGINQAQHNQLKKKPSAMTAKTSREACWEEVYRIIFPDANEIPSPYYEYPGRDDETLDFGEYIREELPQRVRTELEDRCNEFDNGIRTIFIDIVQDILSNMVKQFNEQRHPTAPSGKQSQAAKGARSSVTGMMASEPAIPDVAPDANVGDFLANCNFSQYLSNDSHLSFSLDDCGGIADFNCQFDQPTSFPNDSTYGSLGSSTGSPTSFKGY